jgi:hypothetical protein
MLAALIPIVAAEGIPGQTPAAVLAVPVGVLIFLGTIYLLLRSSLGTKRGYLVLGTAFFGFLALMSLFWAFGAPGTPPATGPTNLPGQVPNEYQPHWTAFAIDSRVADTDEYGFVRQYPEGDWSEVPADFTDEAGAGITDIQGFFTNPNPNQLSETWEPVEVQYTVAPNGFPVIAATFQQTYQPAPPPEDDPEAEPPLTAGGARDGAPAPAGASAGDVVEDGPTETLFAFFDEGAITFPAVALFGVALLLFALHAFLLDADERRERRESTVVVEESEKVPAGA